LVRKIKNLKLGEITTLSGNKSHLEISKAMQETDIFMMPYIIGKHGECEGLPNVLKEAQATGLPVISTSIGGIPEVVQDGKTGFLIKEKDIPDLIQKLNCLIENPSLRAKFGENGRKLTEKEFNLASQTSKLESIYERLIADYEKRI